jgi:hypothetical protein
LTKLPETERSFENAQITYRKPGTKEAVSTGTNHSIPKAQGFDIKS